MIMGKVGNVINMACLLSSCRKYTVEELSKELEVTPRMIRVYKEELDKAGIFIDTIRGPYGGYVLNQKTRIPSRKFNYADFKLMKKISDTIKNPKEKQDFVILMDKVRGVYFDSKEESKELNLNDENLKKYNIIARAIKEKRKVKILYYSFDKGENERIIHPYNLFLYGTGWGTAAYCELRKDIRHFELKRIRKYELLDKNY